MHYDTTEVDDYYIKQEMGQQGQHNIKLNRFEQKIVTEIIPAMEFYAAEAYHQNYYRKNPVQYHYYRTGSGRDQYVKRVWGAQALFPVA